MCKKIVTPIFILAVMVIINLGTNLQGQQQTKKLEIQMLPPDFWLVAPYKIETVTDSVTKRSKPKIVYDEKNTIIKIYFSMYKEMLGIDKPDITQFIIFRPTSKDPKKSPMGDVIFPNGEVKPMANIPLEAWKLLIDLDRRQLFTYEKVLSWHSGLTFAFTKEKFQEAILRLRQGYVSQADKELDEKREAMFADARDRYIAEKSLLIINKNTEGAPILDQADVDSVYKRIDAELAKSMPKDNITDDEGTYSSLWLAVPANTIRPPKLRDLLDATRDLAIGFDLFGGDEIQLIGINTDNAVNLHMGTGTPFYRSLTPEDNSIYFGIKWYEFKLRYRTAIDKKIAFWGDDKFIKNKVYFASLAPKSMVEFKFLPISFILKDMGFFEVSYQWYIDGAQDRNNIPTRADNNNPKIRYQAKIIDKDYFNWRFSLPFSTFADGKALFAIDRYQDEYYFTANFTRNDFGPIVDLYVNWRFKADNGYRERVAVSFATGFPNATFGDWLSLGLTATFNQGEKTSFMPFLQIRPPTSNLHEAYRLIEARNQE